jgi:hypothetical protein
MSSKLKDLLNTHHNQVTNDVEKIVYLEALVMTTKKSHAKVSLEALELKEKFQLMDLRLKKAKERATTIAQKVGMLRFFCEGPI